MANALVTIFVTYLLQCNIFSEKEYGTKRPVSHLVINTFLSDVSLTEIMTIFLALILLSNFSTDCSITITS